MINSVSTCIYPVNENGFEIFISNDVYKLLMPYQQKQPGGFTKTGIAYLFLIHKIWTIILFMNRGQIRILNGKSADVDWNYSRHNHKLKHRVRYLLFMTFVKKPEWRSSLFI